MDTHVSASDIHPAQHLRAKRLNCMCPPLRLPSPRCQLVYTSFLSRLPLSWYLLINLWTAGKYSIASQQAKKNDFHPRVTLHHAQVLGSASIQSAYLWHEPDRIPRRVPLASPPGDSASRAMSETLPDHFYCKKPRSEVLAHVLPR
jgi:hypothetical protein